MTHFWETQNHHFSYNRSLNLRTAKSWPGQNWVIPARPKTQSQSVTDLIFSMPWYITFYLLVNV